MKKFLLISILLAPGVVFGEEDCNTQVWKNRSHATELVAKDGMCLPKDENSCESNYKYDGRECVPDKGKTITTTSKKSQPTKAGNTANSAPAVASTNGSTKTISGAVVDENGKPSAGAFIYAKNFPNISNTYTDIDGKFSIDFPNTETEYCVDVMGFEKTCVAKSTEHVQLKPDSQYLLDEATVVSINCKSPDKLAEIHATKAKEEKDSNGTPYCAPADADSCADFYKYKNGECVSIDGDDCTGEITNADYATRLCTGDSCTCSLIMCKDGYKENDTFSECIEIENKCTTEQEKAIEHGKTFELDTVTDTCRVLSCECGYAPDSLNEKCEKITTCSADNAKSVENKCENDRQICEIKECNDKYELKGNKCVPIAGSCTPDDPNAKSGRREVKDGKEICVVDSCKKNYEVQDGKCVLSNAHSEQELKEKSEKVNELREKEQSVANRAISGVSMGAAGIGGMMLAQSLSEQRVDKESEQDMAAYLATFRCEYAGGKSVPGGTNGVQLPADKLFDLYQEYVTLAADVQDAKSQLGLKPGIESEVILDKANIGLYDDTSTGKTNGTYASVARALTDPNSADAQKWNDQKAQTDKNKKIGLGVGVGGAAVGAVGNILTNHVDWDKIKDKTNNSKENKDKIKTFKDKLKDTGMTNVDKLDLSKLDFSEFNIADMDFNSIATKLKGQDATQLFKTGNAAELRKSIESLNQKQ